MLRSRTSISYSLTLLPPNVSRVAADIPDVGKSHGLRLSSRKPKCSRTDISVGSDEACCQTPFLQTHPGFSMKVYTCIQSLDTRLA